MKTPSFQTVRVLSVVFLLGVLFTLSIAYISRISSEKQVVVPVKPQVLTDPLYALLNDNIWENLSSTVTSHDMVQYKPYKLYRNEVKIYAVHVNLPVFLSQTSWEQRHFFEEIRDVNGYDLLINIAGEGRLDIASIRDVLGKLPPSQNITLAFFDYPPNYTELFDVISWSSSPEMEFTVRMHGAHFPYGFSMDNLILDAKKMVERNNGTLSLKSFSIASEDQSGMRFRLWAEWEKTLQYFPAKKIGAEHIGINNGEPGDVLKWRQRIETFLQASPADEILVSDGRKENGKITIRGF